MSISSLLDLVPTALGALALFAFIYLGLIVRILHALRWRRPELHRLADEESPHFLRERAAFEGARLAGLGFVSVGPLRFGENAQGHPETRWLWQHEEAGTLVFLEALCSPKRPNGAEWTLASALRDGTWIVTTSETRDFPMPQPAGVQEELACELSFSQLWERHLQRVQERHDADGTVPRPLEAGQAQSEWAALLLRRWELWQGDTQRFRNEPDGSLRLALGWMLRHGVPATIRTARSLGNIAKAQLQVPADQPPPLSPEAQVEGDIDHARRLEGAKQARRLSPRARLAVSAVSLLLFAAVMAWRDDLTFAILLTAVVLLHELGHIGAMRLFGSRDTSMLFIPFFGGAALRNDRTFLRPWQEVTIILAGPVPGIALGFVGLGLLLTMPPGSLPDWSKEATGLLLIINIFNLLPLMPLDGGHLVQFALLNRFPYLGALFKAASGLGLLVLGQVLGAHLLWIVAFAFLLRIPLDWRMAGALRDLRKAARAEGFQSTEEEPWLRRIFRRFQQCKFEASEADHKTGEAVRLAQILRQPLPGFGTLLLALAGWTSPLWLPIVGLPLLALQADRTRGAAQQELLASPLPAGWLTAAAARQAAQAVPEAESATADYAQASKLLPSRKEGAPIPAEAWQWVVRGSQKPFWPQLPAVEARDETTLPVTWLAAERLREVLAGDDAAALAEVATVGRRLAEQLHRSPAAGSSALWEHVDQWLGALEAGLAKRQGRKAFLPEPAAAELARSLPPVEWLNTRVTSKFVLEARQRAATLQAGTSQEDFLQRLARRLLQLSMMLERSDVDPSRSVLNVLAAARSASFDPWKYSLPRPAALLADEKAPTPTKRRLPDHWRMHLEFCAATLTRLDMARGALAWHARRAAGSEPNKTDDLRCAWFEQPAPDPLSGERWQLLTKPAGVQSLELPGRRATATPPAEIDPYAMLATMVTPLWSLHEVELDEPAR